MASKRRGYLKYMFSGVDTKVILSAGIIFLLIALITEKDDGAWLLYTIGAGLPVFWFILGFLSWRKYSNGN